MRYIQDWAKAPRHKCAICRTDKSVKYAVKTPNGEITLCNKCIAHYVKEIKE